MSVVGKRPRASCVGLQELGQLIRISLGIARNGRDAEDLGKLSHCRSELVSRIVVVVADESSYKCLFYSGRKGD